MDVDSRTETWTPAVGSDCPACVSGPSCWVDASPSSRCRAAGPGSSRASRWARRAMADKIRILIADDHAVVRAGLQTMINAQPDMEVVGEAASGHEALTRAGALAPDVMTLDLTMPGGSSIKTIERLGRKCP